MDFASAHRYLLAKPGAREDFPFDPDLPVFKVGPRMFAYLSPERTPPWLTLKLDPVRGVMLRAAYPAVRPGYHMNKEHWNTIGLDGTVPEDELRSCIDESYNLVVRRLSRAERAEIDRRAGATEPR